MPTKQNQDGDADEREARTVDRRTLMKAAGTVGIGTVGLGATAGTAVAADTPDQLYFCGCSQLVVTGLGRDACITVYLRRTEEGGCRTVEVCEPECEVGGGREYAYRYTVEDEEAILAVRTPDGNLWCNPNNCAQRWLDTLTCFSGITGSLRNQCTPYSELDNPGDVFTNGCGTVCSGSSRNGPPENRGPPER